MKNLQNFISDSPFQTPPMLVTIIDQNSKVIKTYTTPPGFQLEEYVYHLYPDSELMVTADHLEITVSVILNGTSDIHEIHRGIYQPVFH